MARMETEWRPPEKRGIRLTRDEFEQLPPGSILVPTRHGRPFHPGYPRYEIGPRGGVQLRYSPTGPLHRQEHWQFQQELFELILEPVDITPRRRAS